jgi:hypothetical protein
MPTDRPATLRLRFPAPLAAQLAAEAARTGEPVRTVAAALVAEGLAIYTTRLRGLSPSSGKRRSKQPG